MNSPRATNVSTRGAILPGVRRDIRADELRGGGAIANRRALRHTSAMILPHFQRHTFTRRVSAAARTLILYGMAASAGAQSPEVKDAAQSIGADGLMRHVKVLASDEFEGRAPGTPGEDRTIDYLVKEFKRMGLAPGNPDGTY